MADDVTPLSRFQAVLSRARGSARMRFLLTQPEARALVAELPVQDLFSVIKEVGLEDASELVEMATPEQLQGCLDLDAWRADELDLAALRPWLDALVGAGSAKLTEVWRGLDPELAALIIARTARVYDIVEGGVPESEEPPFFATPDRFFMVKLTSEDPEEARVIERILDWLYREDQELARHTLRAASSETNAHLEELSYRWRAGRMQDLGYADYYEALEVYRPIAIGKDGVAIGEGTADAPREPTTLPAPFGESGLRQGFLGQVLLRIVDAEEARRTETALVLLANRVLSADRVPPGDMDAARRGAARAFATLSLGLEAIARGDAEKGLEALRTVAFTRLHRTGHTLALRLSTLLRALGARADRLDEPLRSMAAALRRPRPEYAAALDHPPGDGTRPFTSLADVSRVAGALNDLALQIRLVYEVLGLDPAKLGPGVTLGDIGRTVVVRAALGRGATFAPLAPKDILALPRQADPPLAAFGREYEPVIRGWWAELTEQQDRVVLE